MSSAHANQNALIRGQSRRDSLPFFISGFLLPLPHHQTTTTTLPLLHTTVYSIYASKSNNHQPRRPSLSSPYLPTTNFHDSLNSRHRHHHLRHERIRPRGLYTFFAIDDNEFFGFGECDWRGMDEVRRCGFERGFFDRVGNGWDLGCGVDGEDELSKGHIHA